MALDEMRKAYADEETRVLIELREKARHAEESRLADAEEAGARKKSIEVARRLHEDGVDREKILKWTGLRPEDLPF